MLGLHEVCTRMVSARSGGKREEKAGRGRAIFVLVSPCEACRRPSHIPNAGCETCMDLSACPRPSHKKVLNSKIHSPNWKSIGPFAGTGCPAIVIPAVFRTFAAKEVVQAIKAGQTRFQAPGTSVHPFRTLLESDKVVFCPIECPETQDVSGSVA